MLTFFAYLEHFRVDNHYIRYAMMHVYDNGSYRDMVSLLRTVCARHNQQPCRNSFVCTTFTQSLACFRSHMKLCCSRFSENSWTVWGRTIFGNGKMTPVQVYTTCLPSFPCHHSPQFPGDYDTCSSRTIMQPPLYIHSSLCHAVMILSCPYIYSGCM